MPLSTEEYEKYEELIELRARRRGKVAIRNMLNKELEDLDECIAEILTTYPDIEKRLYPDWIQKDMK